MKSFVEIREALKLKGGEKEVSKAIIGKGAQKQEITITKKGNRWNLYLDDELAMDNMKSPKEANDEMKKLIKMLGR
jgi:hypothetical protein